MERLLLKGKSKEDMKLIADLAIKIGMTVEYVPDEDEFTTVNEPEALAEWGNLSKNQQQGLPISENIDENDDVIREFRERNE